MLSNLWQCAPDGVIGHLGTLVLGCVRPTQGVAPHHISRVTPSSEIKKEADETVVTMNRPAFILFGVHIISEIIQCAPFA